MTRRNKKESFTIMLP